jgi:hypothetical protein
MSDTEKTTATNGSAATFTERELQILCWAMQSLKSGPPEVRNRHHIPGYMCPFLPLHTHSHQSKIDYDKLAAFAGMTNPRSAANIWAKVKVKLSSPSSDGPVPATPKKTPRAKKTAASKVDGEEGDAAAAASPTKTPRKRAPKKQDVDGESSPKKKPAHAKKTSSDESEHFF